jgi:hypothetical protein
MTDIVEKLKEIYKHPLFFYILAAALAILWPIFMTVYLHRAQAAWKSDTEQYTKAQQLIEELLAIDPDRLNYTKGKNTTAGFDYATAVQQAAEFCSIPADNYKLSSGIIIKSEGQKNQSAVVVLKGVEITKAARFLSTIQLRWAGLQCTKITFRKNKGAPDAWDVDLTFKYYY